jgi:hypothetical protein
MAGTGPAPAEQKRRRNKDQFEELPAEGYQGDFPKLPKTYRVERTVWVKDKDSGKKVPRPRSSTSPTSGARATGTRPGRGRRWRSSSPASTGSGSNGSRGWSMPMSARRRRTARRDPTAGSRLRRHAARPPADGTEDRRTRRSDRGTGEAAQGFRSTGAAERREVAAARCRCRRSPSPRWGGRSSTGSRPTSATAPATSRATRSTSTTRRPCTSAGPTASGRRATRSPAAGSSRTTPTRARRGAASPSSPRALVCAEGLGPVRCERNADGSAGFDANGDPVGVPVTYPFIRCLATEEEQTGNTYDKAYYMLTEGEVTNAFALDVGLTRTFIKEQGGGEIRPSTSGDASKDGGLESSVGDETHLYVQPGLRGCTARSREHRQAQDRRAVVPRRRRPRGSRASGRSPSRPPTGTRLPTEEAVTKHGVLYDHRQGDEPKRFGDDRSLIKAMRPATARPPSGWTSTGSCDHPRRRGPRGGGVPLLAQPAARRGVALALAGGDQGGPRARSWSSRVEDHGSASTAPRTTTTPR